MTPSEIYVKFLEDHVGHAYVMGARGQPCTPAYRQGEMKRLPYWYAKIKANCPVLSGKQKTCSGCKYNGKNCYDCRGLTAAAVEAATGRPIYGSGVSSQWYREDNWVEKGLIKDMPKGKPCVLMVWNGKTFPHTGGSTGKNMIHAAGHSQGVIKSSLPYSATHYAIPVGMYPQETTADKFRDFAKQLDEIADTLEGIKLLYQAKINTRYPAGLGLYKTMSKIVLGGKIRDIAKGEIVNVLEEVNANWVKVEYKGSIGYIDRQYLGAKLPPVVPPKPVPLAVIASIRKLGADAITIAVELEKLN